MAETSWKLPSNAINQSKGGSSWLIPENIVSNNGIYVSSRIPAQSYSDWLQIYNFNCGISDESIINGIEIQIDRKSGHYGVHRDDNVKLAVGTAGRGSDYYKADTFYLITDSIAIYGGLDDLWGTTWTPAQINNLSIFYSVVNDGCCSENCYIDCAWVKVWYSDAPASKNFLLLGTIF